MNNVIARLHRDSMMEKRVAIELLAILLSRSMGPAQAHVPSSWEDCIRIDLKTDSEWLDVQSELIPITDSAVLSIAHAGKKPIDVMIMRQNMPEIGQIWSLVVRTANRVELAA